jgi:Lipocalin-like domain
MKLPPKRKFLKWIVYLCSIISQKYIFMLYSKITLALGLFIILGAASCKKDDPSGTANLTGQSCWKNTKTEDYDLVTKKWVNIPIEACSADNCTTFKADGKSTTTDGTIKCKPTDPATTTGSWKLSADEKILTLVDDSFPLPIATTVVELTATKLVFEIDFGADGKIRTTFTGN